MLGAGKRFVRRAIASATAAVLFSANASAQSAGPITLKGDYTFTSSAQNGDSPLCTERWRFDADGTLIVHSGQEIVTDRFRMENADKPDDAGVWLVREYVKTNGRPDCTGLSENSVPTGEYRTYLYLAADGGIVTCLPPGKHAPGVTAAPVPFGHLMRAPEGHSPSRPQ